MEKNRYETISEEKKQKLKEYQKKDIKKQKSLEIISKIVIYY